MPKLFGAMFGLTFLLACYQAPSESTRSQPASEAHNAASSVAATFNPNDLLGNKIRCTEVGWKFFDRQKKEDAEAPYPPDVAYLEVRYAYSPELQTCICSYEKMFKTQPLSHFFIWDTLTGKMLAHATTAAPDSIAPFEEKWSALLGISREDDVLRGRP